MATTSPRDFPSSYKRKLLARLKNQVEQGLSQEELTQDECDLLHMETSEANVHYWKDENERAESDERCLHCQSIARSIIVALRALDPPIDDERECLLSGIIAEAGLLPETH